jgi:hypothetical protein
MLSTMNYAVLHKGRDIKKVIRGNRMARGKKVIAKIVWRRHVDRNKLIRALVDIAREEQERKARAGRTRPEDAREQSHD